MLISSITSILTKPMDITKQHKKALKRLEKANSNFGKAKNQIRKRAYKRKKYEKWLGCEEIGIKSWVPLWIVWILIKMNIVGARYIRVDPITKGDLEYQKDV